MPAPKTPNTSAATAASVAARRHAKYQRMADELRKAGWHVVAPNFGMPTAVMHRRPE